MITIKNIWNRDSNEAKFIRAYLECALWSSSDESDESGGNPLDQNYDLSDFDESAINDAITDCQDFMRLYSGAFNGAYDQAGYDLWLTRNGHGTGFWDRPEVYGESHAKQLTKACGFRKKFSGLNAYVHDGKIFFAGG